MDAVLGVDDELRVAFFLADDLVNARRAITLRRLVVHRQIVIDRNIGIAQRQVDRLILLMVGIRQEHRRQAIKSDHTVGLGIGNRLHKILAPRSEEHTSELQSLMRISYAVFCLKKKNKSTHNKVTTRNKHIEQ